MKTATCCMCDVRLVHPSYLVKHVVLAYCIGLEGSVGLDAAMLELTYTSAEVCVLLKLRLRNALCLADKVQ